MWFGGRLQKGPVPREPFLLYIGSDWHVSNDQSSSLILGSWGRKMRKENACAVRTLSKNRTGFSFQTCCVLTHALRPEPNTDIASSSSLVGLLCTRARGTGSAHYLLTSLTWCKIMTSCCLEGAFFPLWVFCRVCVEQSGGLQPRRHWFSGTWSLKGGGNVVQKSNSLVVSAPVIYCGQESERRSRVPDIWHGGRETESAGSGEDARQRRSHGCRRERRDGGRGDNN